MEGLSNWTFLVIAALVVVAPCFLIAAVLKKLDRPWVWALIWPALIIGLYAYVVIAYRR